MKKLRRLLIALAILLVLLGGWWTWLYWWSGDMIQSAAFANDVDRIELLLTLGADPYATAGTLSSMEPETLKVLLEAGMKPNSLYDPIEPISYDGSPPLVYRNVTLLMYAAWNGNIDILEPLLSAGAEIRTVCGRGNTALHYLLLDTPHRDNSFAISGSRILLKAGADPNRRNKEGKTPLDIWPALADIVKEVEGEDRKLPK